MRSGIVFKINIHRFSFPFFPPLLLSLLFLSYLHHLDRSFSSFPWNEIVQAHGFPRNHRSTSLVTWTYRNAATPIVIITFNTWFLTRHGGRSRPAPQPSRRDAHDWRANAIYPRGSRYTYTRCSRVSTHLRGICGKPASNLSFKVFVETPAPVFSPHRCLQRSACIARIVKSSRSDVVGVR